MIKAIELEAAVDGTDQIINGRFIGFIKDDEFNALCQNPNEVGGKLESKASQDIMKVAGKFDNMTGYRMCVVMKKSDGRNVMKKTLFISEPLSMIDSVKPRVTRHEWDSEAGAWKDKPGEVTFQTLGENNIVIREAE